MNSSSDDPTLTLEFRYLAGGGREAALLQVTLPSGAKFVCDVNQLSGKLGSNLQLFYQAVKASHRPEGTANALTARPEYPVELVKLVAPGTAYGVNPLKDAEKRKRERREIQDQLDSLEITL